MIFSRLWNIIVSSWFKYSQERYLCHVQELFISGGMQTRCFCFLLVLFLLVESFLTFSKTCCLLMLNVARLLHWGGWGGEWLKMAMGPSDRISKGL